MAAEIGWRLEFIGYRCHPANDSDGSIGFEAICRRQFEQIYPQCSSGIRLVAYLKAINYMVDGGTEQIFFSLLSAASSFVVPEALLADVMVNAALDKAEEIKFLMNYCFVKFIYFQ